MLALHDATHRVADLGFAHHRDLRYEPLHDVERDRFGIEVSAQAVRKGRLDVDLDDPAGGAALGEGLRRFRFHADHADLRVQARGGDGNSADQSAAADRHDDSRDVAALLQDLERRRSGTRDDVVMAVR